MVKLLVLVSVVFVCILTIPYHDQRALASSLIVGNDDEKDLYSWTCKVCDQSNKPIHAHIIQEEAVDVKAIVTMYSDFIVLAFRYTNTALNIWQDILYPLQIKDQYTCSKCKVQKAYHNMWETIKEDVISDLTSLQKQSGIQTLYITGISMGGGLSVISFIDLNQARIFDHLEVITFGAPRVGNNHWAAYFDLITTGKTYRYVVKGDPIVVLPRCLTLLCTYQQTGILYVCNEDTNKCVEQAVDDRKTLKNFFFNRKALDSDIRNIRGIDSHINGYPKTYNYTLIKNQ